MFYNSGGHGPQTASNNSPAVTTPAPALTPKQ